MKEQKRCFVTEGKKRICCVLLLFLLLCSVLMAGHFVTANEPLLQETNKTVYAGDSILLTDYFTETKEVASAEYQIESTSENPSCITVDEKGKVEAVEPGKAEVSVSYVLEEETELRTETFAVEVLEPEEIQSVYGEVISNLQAYAHYDMDHYELESSVNSVAVTAKQELTVQGFERAEIFLRAKDDSENRFMVARVIIESPAFSSDTLTRATETEAFLPEILFFTQVDEETEKEYNKEVLEAGKISDWKIADESIASMSEEGVVALKVGETELSVKIQAKNGEEKILQVKLVVTDPKLVKDMLVLAKGTTQSLEFTGVCEESVYIAEKSQQETKDDAAYITAKNDVYASQKGTVTVGIFVDGRKFAFKVLVTNPKVSEKAFIMYKTQSKTVKVTGIDSTYSTVKYSSSNTKLATVSSKGVVKAKKSGRVRIYAVADGKRISILAEVTSKAGYQASKKAIAISKTKTQYSQIKRMKSGYYDCSSLVSRVYRKYGVYFGSKSGWSPTAAGIGQWCAKNGKVLYTKGVKETKLLPGDIVCYSYTKNGRYKNISHIEIYVGNGMSVSASSSNNKVIHYAYKSSSAVLIARPKK